VQRSDCNKGVGLLFVHAPSAPLALRSLDERPAMHRTPPALQDLVVVLTANRRGGMRIKRILVGGMFPNATEPGLAAGCADQLVREKDELYQ
jgi:hypothetical protein